MADDDSDDSMPPLEGVAAPPVARPPVASGPAASTSVQAANNDEASDDSLPPLEFVGTSQTPSREGLRPGDKVVLEGLSTTSLNGQQGTVLPFTDADTARKGRLGVRLDNGKQMSVKHENLRKVAAVPEREAEDGGASDDSMPPLDYVGTDTQPAQSSKVEAAATPQKDDAESDDSMPPLDFVGVSERASPSAPAALPKADAADDDDDDMPPLDYVGTAPKADVKTDQAANQEDSSDDDMPPLDYVGTAPKADVKTEQSAKKEDSSDDDMPPLDYVGTAPKADVKTDKLAKKEDSSDDDMPPLDYVGTAPKSDVKTDKSARKEDSSDDDMPPLDYVGTAPKADVKTDQTAKQEDSSDDDMPPLDYVGTAPKADVKTNQSAKQEDASDDSMPPLEHVGTSQAAPQDKAKTTTAAPTAAPVAPPVVASAAAPAAPTPPRPEAGSDDSMPALEYVGTSPETCREGLRPGDKVVLEKLSTASLNGQCGTVLPFKDADVAKKGRLGVRLDSGKEMSIKRENLKKVEIKAAIEKADAASDDSMPPLESVGTPAGEKSPAPPAAQKADPEDDEDDDMPPLEYVGTAPKGDEKPTTSENKEASDDSMPPLDYVGPPQAKADTQADESDDSMPPLDYVGSGPNVEKGKEPSPKELQQDGESGDSMPPLDYVGVAPTPKESKVNQTEEAAASDDSMPPLDYVGAAPVADTANKADADSDDSMPPLDYVGSAPAADTVNKDAAESDESMPPLDYVGTAAPADKSQPEKAAPEPPQAFQPDDQVSLHSLSSAALNGQRGTVMPKDGVQSGRVAVKLESGRVLAVKIENLTKVTPAAETKPSQDDEASDDSMPPLDYVGSAPAADTTNKGTAESDDSMPPLDYVGSGPAQTASKDEAESDDSMPPLDYVGNAPAQGAAVASNAAAESAAADAASDDSMPPLDYVGAATSSQASKAKQEATSTTKPTASASTSKPAFSVGDVVVLKDLSNAAFNGQRAVVLIAADTADGRLTVKLEKSGQKLAVKLDKVDSASMVQDDAESFDSMPPLDYVGSEVQPSSVANKPVENASAQVRPAVPEKDDAASDESMPPLDYVGSAAPKVEGTSTVANPAAPSNDDAASDDSMPPLDYVGKSSPQAADSDDSMPPLDYVGEQKQENTSKPEEGDDDSHDSMPPLEYKGAPPASESKAETSPVKESKPGNLQNGGKMPIKSAAAAAAAASLSQRLLQSGQSKPSAGAPRQGGSSDGFSVGNIVVLKGFKTSDLNGQRATIVQRTKLTPKGKLEVELKNGKRMAVSFTKVDKLAEQGTVQNVVDNQIDNDAPASDDSLPPLEDDAGHQNLKVGDIVMLKDLAKTELNGQHATVITDSSKDGDGRLKVKLIGSGAKLAVLKEKVERVKAAPTAPAAATGKTAEPAEAEPAPTPKAAAASKKVVTAEGLLEKMKEAMQGTSEQLISSTIEAVEANKDLNWGELLPKKKQLLKKLRAKKRKLDGDTSVKVESEVSAAEFSSAPAVKIVRENQAIPEVRGSASDVSSDSKEKPWMVLNPSTQESPGVSLEAWCAQLELPPELLVRLREEEVKTPHELTFVPEEDLKAIVSNLKIGPKGRFMAAVQALKR